MFRNTITSTNAQHNNRGEDAMNTRKKGLGWRVLAGLTAASLAMLGGTTMAAADDPTTPPAPSIANINPQALGSVTIYKFEEPAIATGLPHNGTALTPAQLAGLTPLPGVTFSVQKVTSIDLTTVAGWAAAQGLTATTVIANPGSYPLGSAATDVTDGAGRADFTSLPVGLYLVRETNAPASVVNGMDPFLVSIPLATNGVWNYDVTVYPKNSTGGLTKTVNDAAAYEIGDTITWTITAKVPAMPATDDFTQFVLRDNKDARLAFAGNGTVTLRTAANVVVPLVPADYTITQSGNQAVLTFTGPGYVKLAQAPLGTVTWVLDTTVVGPIGTEGVLTNDADLFVNGTEFDADAQSNWGNLEVFKYATIDESRESLQGAVFEIFTDAGTTQSLGTFTTNVSGLINVSLKAGNYWIKEVTPPLGYKPISTVFPVTITTATTQSPKVRVEIENEQVPSYELPLTGGSGTLMFSLGGAALILIAGGAAYFMPRRRVQKA